MSIIDYLLLTAVFAAAAFALRFIYKKKKSGGSCCSGCSGNCSACKH